MIDVFIPVLGRPENTQKVVDSFRATSSQMDEIHFICSPGDDAEIEACLQTGENVLIVDWQPKKADYAKKMNYAFSLTSRPWVFLGADDIEFQPHWSEEALRHERADVIATNDLSNTSVKHGLFGTHCLVRRSYVEERGASADGPGILLHEGYDHNYVDRELCHLAQYRGVFSFAERSHVLHRHPHWGTAAWDDTYRKGMAHFQRDHRLFMERAQMWGYVGTGKRRVRSKSRS